MKNQIKTILSTLTAGAFVFALSGRANADEILKLTDTSTGAFVQIDATTDVTTSGNGTGGAFVVGIPTFFPTGDIDYTGAVGTNWTVNVTGAATYPDLGTTTSPVLNLSTRDESSSPGTTLTISFMDTGYTTGPAGVTAAAALTSVATGGSVTYQTFLNGATLITTSTLSMNGSGTTSFGGYPGVTSSGTLGEVITITDAPGEKGNYNASFDVTVPDGGMMTVALLGLSLVGLVVMGTMRKKLVA